MATLRRSSETNGATRHTPYPYYSLQKALEVGEVVKELGGTNSDVQKSLVAHHLKLEDDSPSLVGILGAAKLYDILDGRGSYRLTELARQYYYPTSPTERQAALARMASGPPLFAALIDKFDGTRLPSAEVLVNIVHREHNIAASWRTRAVSLFLSSLRDAQLIDAAGFLRFRASLDAATNEAARGHEIVELAPAPREEKQPSERVTSSAAQSGNVSTWCFRGIRLETPTDMSADLWKRLLDYVSILRPEEAKD